MYSGNPPHNRNHNPTYAAGYNNSRYSLSSYSPETDSKKGPDSSSFLSADHKQEFREGPSNEEHQRPKIQFSGQASKKVKMFPDSESLISFLSRKREQDVSQVEENGEIINELLRQMRGADDRLGLKHLTDAQLRKLISEFIIAKICILTGDSTIYKAPWENLNKALLVENWPTQKVQNIKFYKSNTLREFAKNMIHIKLSRNTTLSDTEFFDILFQRNSFRHVRSHIGRELKKLSGKYFKIIFSGCSTYRSSL
jgi:hypothetical protein